MSKVPRPTVRNVVKMYQRRVWHSPGYMEGMPASVAWRIPPISEREEGEHRKGVSMFFYPASKTKKSNLHAYGPLGKVKTVTPDTALDIIQVSRAPESLELRYFSHNRTRGLVANAFSGVQEGFSVVLELHGLGYRAEDDPDDPRMLGLKAGYKNPVRVKRIIRGCQVKILEPTKIRVSGTNKRDVHNVAAWLRSYRPPEPYKGKGIRYEGEEVRLRPGKRND